MINDFATPETFLDVYNLTIAPKLKEVDIFLKENQAPITIWELSQILDIPYSEASEILHMLKIDNLNTSTIFSLIMHGKSEICKLIQREVQRGFPLYYTPDDISFIYEIDILVIQSVFEMLNTNKVKAANLPFVFELLPAQIN